MIKTDLPLTDDTLFNGRLICKQYKSGYRFSIDAVLVAHFCRLGTGDTILDLGCGCGIIGLVLAYRQPGVVVTGVEIQHELAQLAQNNILANDMKARMSVIEGNFRDFSGLIAPESFDLVVSNPPYGKQGRGRMNPDSQRARARHEIDASLADLIQAAAYSVKNRGKVVVIYPAVQAVSLIAAMRNHNLEPKRLQPIYSYPDQVDAALILVEAVKNGGEDVRLLPPFYIYTEKNGPYSRGMQELYKD